ncbi:MAG: calcineurin-like phosphoesterase family protein [Pirellulales bacterium]|nr:calcineurin-like phosphoesterase family protein [Pirellulales bacterium]
MSRIVLSTVLVSLLVAPSVDAQQMARGRVYHDTNFNQVWDTGEKGLAGISVSNGEDIVRTSKDGSYELSVSDDAILFVIKPAGWMTPLSETNLPRFYYIHKPKGSPQGTRFPGVEPTGDLPASIDFPLHPVKEPERFKAIMFADPQPRNQQEVDYLIQDVLEELIGTDASFGVTLGDIMFDDLSLFESQNQGIALVGIPWYNVIGNHDVNREAKVDEESDETFERVFGPAYYSFEYGKAHFVVMDNVEWYYNGETKKHGYRGAISKAQMKFLENDLKLVPADKLVVLMMHIPITKMEQRGAIFKLLKDRPFTMSVSGHQHYQQHLYLGKEDGWEGEKPHHHVINVTASGSWWKGIKKFGNTPHAYSRDGVPNGYSIVTFDGNQSSFQYQAANRPADYQMQISAPVEIGSQQEQAYAYANVFSGSEKSEVTAVIRNRKGKAVKLEMVAAHSEVDPDYKRLYDQERSLMQKLDGKIDWMEMSAPAAAGHLWKAQLPKDLSSGMYSIEVQAIQPNGAIYKGLRPIRVAN